MLDVTIGEHGAKGTRDFSALFYNFLQIYVLNELLVKSLAQCLSEQHLINGSSHYYDFIDSFLQVILSDAHNKLVRKGFLHLHFTD